MLINEVKGEDCTHLFKAAYENRYTWESDFSGYEGNCSWTCLLYTSDAADE